MINLTKNDGQKILVNVDEIEFIEYSYETIINLLSGRKIIVKESPEEIRAKAIEYHKACHSDDLEMK